MLNRDEALELFERLPYIRTLQAANDRTLEQLFREALAKEDYLQWVQIIKTCYVRQHDTSKSRRPLTPALAQLGQQANDRFRQLLANALDIAPEQVDAYINTHLEENW